MKLNLSSLDLSSYHIMGLPVLGSWFDLAGILGAVLGFFVGRIFDRLMFERHRAKIIKQEIRNIDDEIKLITANLKLPLLAVGNNVFVPASNLLDKIDDIFGPIFLISGKLQVPTANLRRALEERNREAAFEDGTTKTVEMTVMERRNAVRVALEDFSENFWKAGVTSALKEILDKFQTRPLRD